MVKRALNMTCLFHVEGLRVPASFVPADRIGPELHGDMRGSATIGVFPIDEDFVLVGKLTLLIKSDKSKFAVGNYETVPPTNLQDHLELNDIIKELCPTLYNDRSTFKWCTKLVLIS
jgi:hypothetical protein